jgi:predicted AAA+ superfamily ATPase
MVSGVMDMEYKKRVIDEQLRFLLTTSGAVLIEGPKWCGKTTSAKQIAKSMIEMDEPKNRLSHLNFAKIAPEILLDGEVPRLIDEWQVAPVLWDAVRHEVDRRSTMGQFILTGSSTPINRDEIIHSGAGRITTLKMRPMSLFESGDSDGSISLKTIFEGKPIVPQKNSMTIQRLSFLLCRGGWPLSLNLEERASLQQAKNYYKAVTESDISRVDGVARDSNKVKALMKSIARNIASQASIPTLLDDLKHGDSRMSDVTVASYLSALKTIHVIDDLEAWNPNLRSKSAIRTSPTRHFVDPSIATAALGISPSDLLFDFHTMGLVFESMCIRDLRVYADALEGHVLHYRDSSNLECDAIIHLDNGDWGAVEIKLAEHLVETGVKTLHEIANKIDKDTMKKPSFLMVLTGDGYSYQREDGIYVISVASLRP